MECPGCGRKIDSDSLTMAIERSVGLRCLGCGSKISHERMIRAVALTLSRKDHPETSAEAAAYIAPKRREKQLRAFGFVIENPGKTANELARISQDRDTRTIGRRLPELEKKGLVIRGGPRRCEITGRKATIWYPVGSTNNG